VRNRSTDDHWVYIKVSIKSAAEIPDKFKKRVILNEIQEGNTVIL